MVTIRQLMVNVRDLILKVVIVHSVYNHYIIWPEEYWNQSNIQSLPSRNLHIYQRTGGWMIETNNSIVNVPWYSSMSIYSHFPLDSA